ncbi:putative FAD-linked oxidoreductase [bioreactor metagenome]|uniref:Putative FAD-linked oxidoreductase n=1 Tax=bioreactor metagenome TaxID=1076179 RepID=A0A644SYE9_9ZZZZ|nr:FAD-binding oxidoreductase [Negativicutes bacterium]
MTGVKNVTVSASDQLQEVFRQAQQDRNPVYLYRKPGEHGISLDLSQWNEIEVFDVDNLMAIVPPGLLLKDLNKAAAAKGLRFIPADSPILESLSVGEWAHRGCPNLLSWKYGAGKHFLLGSSYVFPNGEITAVGGKCIKNVSGYDLTRFLTGAYADLAVGVQFVLKLMPQPACRLRYDVEVASLEAASKLAGELQSRPVPPAWLYWADPIAGTKLFGQKQQGQRIIFELDGNEAEVNDYAAAVNKMLTVCKAKNAAVKAKLPDLSYLETKEEGFWLVDEFKIPYPGVSKFAETVKKALKENNWEGGLFGQLADGKINLYVKKADIGTNIFITKLQDQARALGGVSTGKYERVHGAGGSGALAVLEKNFKQCMDPAQIFNRPAGVIK